MNRILAFCLSALLLAGLVVPAMAAPETADTRLARVTQTVKDLLDLDTERYTDFHGDVYEQELGTVWTLNWNGENESLNIEALENGSVISYWRSDASESYYYGSNLPVLPKLDPAAAKAAAEAFLKRVLDPETETVVLEEPVSAGRLNSASCRFSGSILLNGLPSPLNYHIVVNSSNQVASFRRDALATAFLGNIPSARPAVTAEAAAEALKGTLALELIYVTSEEDQQRAVLRYVPKDEKVLYVDAQTGELVTPSGDMTLFNGAAAAPEAAEADSGGGMSKRALTATELSGIEKLEGVLDRDALDKLVRAESAYKLDGRTLSSANYRLIKEGPAEQETETVLCTLQYADEENSYVRTFTVDARTGAVRSLYSYGRWDKDRVPAVSAEDAQKTAQAFLGRFTDRAAEFDLYHSDDNTADGAPSYGFTFARKVNGVFFPENACTVQIDCEDGSVCGVNYTYDEDKTFDSVDGIVTEAAALDAWASTYETVLAYRALPKDLDPSVPQEAKLIDIGLRQFQTLFLSYALEREGYIPGIDARTGKPVELSRPDGEIAYDDLSGHWAAADIERLAGYGIGYDGGSFLPDRVMTQWELVALLASTRGMRLNPETASKEERDAAYYNVYEMGALRREDRKEDAPVTRSTLVKCLLDSAGFAPVAKLEGIFACGYADSADIPADELGYAALAQGFGLVKNNRFDGGAPASRAMAAVMLLRLMQRDA